MFKHILIPLDGSSLAESVLPAARFFALNLHADLTLLHIVEPAPPATVHGEPHLMGADDAQKYLDSLAHELGEQSIDVQTHIHRAKQGNVALSILHRAQELQTDLILLCSHGRSGLRDMLFGSIAQQTLNAGDIPVLLVHPPRDEFKLERILIPLDGRTLYEPALHAARELAHATHAALQLVIVVPTIKTLTPERAATGTLLPASTQAVLDLAERGASEYLARWLTKLKAENVEASAQVLRGETVPMILRAAEHASADLIVMATHGRAGLAAFWSGSVAPNVLRHAKIPILLLRVTGDEPVR